MENILVISQDQNVFSVFESAGLKAIKVTSAAAAMVMLKDKNTDQKLIFIDTSFKNLEEVRRLIIKKEIRHFVIGQDLPKPLKVSHLKQILANDFSEMIVPVISDKNPIEEHYPIEPPMSKDKPSLHKLLTNLKTKSSTVSNEKKEPTPANFVQQQVIALLRVKGGVGTTLIASNLAKTLEDLKVCIIDLNFGDGGSDLSYVLDLPKIPHWGIFLRDKNKMSFREALVTKGDISVLQVPPSLHLLEDLKIEDIARVINYAKKYFNIIILDLPNELNDYVKEALEYASTTLIISGGNLSELVRIEKMIGIPENLILVLNRRTNELNSFREYLGIKNIICIEQDELLKNENDKRGFLKNCPFGDGIDRLCQSILGQGKLSFVK